MVLEYKVYEEIPTEIFQGIDSFEEGDVIMDTDPDVNVYGNQFIISTGKADIQFIGLDGETVTVDHIKSINKWYRIGHVIGEYSTQY